MAAMSKALFDEKYIDAAIAIIRGETLEEAAREIERQLYVERHPLAQAIRALKDRDG